VQELMERKKIGGKSYMKKDELIRMEMQVKPKIRWWLPGAFMEKEELEQEIEDLVAAGYGGAEILYFMGIPSNDIKPEAYTEYYFGSDRWNDLMKQALKKAIEHNFKLDFTVGPLWPIASPAIPAIDDERASWGLHIGTTSFANTYRGELPSSDTIDKSRAYKIAGASIAKQIQKESNVYLLNSARVVTQHMNTRNNTIDLNLRELFKEDEELLQSSTDEWTLFVFYEQTSGQMNDSSGTPVIDHLSKAAAGAIIDYWENVLMRDEELRQLYEENGGDLFCDSIEVNASMLGGMYDARPLPVILWSPDFLETFQTKRGYDLTPFLPCLFIEGLYQHSAVRNVDHKAKYEFDATHVNVQIQNDFYQTITDMINENHIKPLKEFVNRHNMKLRYQVYGLPTQMSSSLHYVDVPESESLGFQDNIDSCLLLAGAVHVEKKSVYSYELGAIQGLAYQQMWTGRKGLLWQLHQAMAAGVNQVVLHGMSYNTKSVIGPVEPIFKWPGLSLMGTAYSNEWGNRQPIWEHSGMMTSYISRLQWLLRQGTPRVDIAVYRQEFDGVNYSMPQNANPLSISGYSYEYLSTFLLTRIDSKVTKEQGKVIWDQEGAAYKALIIDYQRNRETNLLQQPRLSLEAMGSFVKLAEKGFPIFWGIGEPECSSSYQSANDLQRIREAYQQLLRYPTVYILHGTDDLIQQMNQAEIVPDRIVTKASSLIHVHRRSENMDYYYIYNQSENKIVDETVELSGTGTPCIYNCWTGEIQTIEHFSVKKGYISFQHTFQPNEVMTLMIGNHVGNYRTMFDASSFSNELKLTSWNLTVKKYLPGDHPTKTLFVKESVNLESLVPWRLIPGLETVSGMGVYTTVFELPEKVERCMISFGEAADTVKIIVNGHTFLPDQITKKVEITNGILVGKNQITIEVASTLNNALSVMGEKEALQDYGLFGPVILKYSLL
jgi:hypothetical protein